MPTPTTRQDVCLLCGGELYLKSFFQHCLNPACDFVRRLQILGTPGFHYELRRCPSCGKPACGYGGGHGSLIGRAGDRDAFRCGTCLWLWTAEPPTREAGIPSLFYHRKFVRETALELAACFCGNLRLVQNDECERCGAFLPGLS